MATSLDSERLDIAFQSRPDLVADIQRAADSPARVALFNNIVGYVYDQLCNDDEPTSKRRKVDSNGIDKGSGGTSTTLPSRQSAASVSGSASAAASETLLLEIREISFSLPQRKKFDLCITQTYLYAKVPGTTAPVQGTVYAWENIEYAFYVPVPDKAQLQYNCILFPRGVALAPLSRSAAPSNVEPIIFTVPNSAPKPGSISGPSSGLAASVSDSYGTLLHWALEGQLHSSGNTQVHIVGTDAKVFHSVARQPHRPNEKAVHVRAFRGSKDGYLFFLPTGILWGFKKPLLFMPLDRIIAVSYTSVLQRTFNIVVEVEVDGTPEEVEFGMLDQEDYGGIDETYVRRHGLQDRSMAEQRKAKRELAENARSDDNQEDVDRQQNGEEGDGEPALAEDDGLTELQRAEQQLQDEEDEMEEDYDPGSDDDSGGSGSSSEEDVDKDEDEAAEEDEEGQASAAKGEV